MRIGIFDSGVGGLTVLKSIYDKYPSNEYFYIGDNKNNPYGDKTKDELYSYGTRIIDYFVSINIDLIVIACNTICSNILDKIKNNYKNIVIIGVIDSTIKEFISRGKSNVLVIGTVGTINANMYETNIKKINKNIKVHSLATPLLVPLIESGKPTKKVVDNYLKNYKIDSIILGCTHYKLIENDIPKNIEIINSSDGVVNDLDRFIKNTKSSLNIYTTGNITDFNKLCIKIIGINAKYIDI